MIRLHNHSSHVMMWGHCNWSRMESWFEFSVGSISHHVVFLLPQLTGGAKHVQSVCVLLRQCCMAKKSWSRTDVPPPILLNGRGVIITGLIKGNTCKRQSSSLMFEVDGSCRLFMRFSYIVSCKCSLKPNWDVNSAPTQVCCLRRQKEMRGAD